MAQIKIQNVSVSIEGPGVRFKQENIWNKMHVLAGFLKLHHFWAMAWIWIKTDVNTLNKLI